MKRIDGNKYFVRQGQKCIDNEGYYFYMIIHIQIILRNYKARQSKVYTIQKKTVFKRKLLMLQDAILGRDKIA